MKSRIWIPALLILAAIAIVGCEEKTKYITTAEVPAVPVGVYSVTGDGYVDVIWQANNDRGNTDGYGVYRYTGTVGGSDEYALLGTVDASPLAETYSFRDSDVQNGETYYYAVNAFNDYGESELSDPDAFDTPRPDGNATVRDFHTYPADGGFDFSRARVVSWDDATSDVYFEFDSNLDAFFFFAGNEDVDIMDFGYTDALNDVGWGDPGEGDGWSQVGWMELTLGHSYIVWTADNHYATFRVKSLGVSNISIDWAYQTDEGNPELKRAPKVSPPHAENYGRRSGN